MFPTISGIMALASSMTSAVGLVIERVAAYRTDEVVRVLSGWIFLVDAIWKDWISRVANRMDIKKTSAEIVGKKEIIVGFTF